MRSLLFRTLLFSFAFWPAAYSFFNVPLYFFAVVLNAFLIKKISKRMLLTFILVTLVFLLQSIVTGTPEWYYTTVYLIFVFIVTEIFRSFDESAACFKSTSLYITITHLILSYSSFIIEGNLLHIFFEPSHIGVSIGPFFAVAVISRTSLFSKIFLFMLMTGYAIHLPSITFAVCYLCTLIYWMWHPLRYYTKAFFAILLMVLTYFISTKLFEIGVKTESIFIWGYGFVRAFDILSNNLFGVGTFGWVREFLVVDLSDLETLNDRDLASIIPFVLSSFGVFALFLLARILSPKPYISYEFNFFIFVVLTMSAVRWTGPSLGLLVLVISLFFLNGQRRYYHCLVKSGADTS